MIGARAIVDDEGRKVGRGARKSIKAPDFVVNSKGTVMPVPKGANSIPAPVVNEAKKQTGVSYVGGTMNNKPTSLRMMDPVPPRGRSSGYPNGYNSYAVPQVKGRAQTVDP